MILIALYARQSLDVKDSISIEVQIEKGKELLRKGENYGVYKDKGFSGKNTKRPDFQRLMDDVAKGNISKIIVYRFDRFSRSLLDFCITWEYLSRYGVEFVSVNENFDTSTPLGKAIMFILMIFAQMERETISERVTDNYYERAKQGSWMGGPAPYGFEIDRLMIGNREVPTLRCVPDKMEVVREIFQRYALEPDISLGKISKDLNLRGIPGKKRSTWNNVSIARMLCNPLYVKADADIYAYYKTLGVDIANDVSEFSGISAGMLVGKRKAADASGIRKRNKISDAKFSIANWPGYIDSGTWIKCQQRLAMNEQLKRVGKGKNTWLTGLIFCGYCNRRIVAYKDNNTLGSPVRLSCAGHRDDICDHVIRYQGVELEDYVERKLISLLEECEQKSNSEVVVETIEISNQEKIEIQQIEEKIQNFLACIESGQASDITMKYINAEIEKLSNRQAELHKKIIEPVRQEIKFEKIDFKHLEFEEKKLVASTYIKAIKIFNNCIEIVWKF